MSSLCLLSIHTTKLLIRALEKQKVQEPILTKEGSDAPVIEEQEEDQDQDQEHNDEEDQENDDSDDDDTTTPEESKEDQENNDGDDDDTTPPEESKEDEEIRNRLLDMIDSWKPIPDTLKVE